MKELSESQFSGGKWAVHCKVWGFCAISLAEMADLICLPFLASAQVGPKEPRIRVGNFEGGNGSQL